MLSVFRIHYDDVEYFEILHVAVFMSSCIDAQNYLKRLCGHLDQKEGTVLVCVKVSLYLH